MERKKALAYLGGPRQLEDFIWYYLTKGKEYDWTLICQPMFPEMKLKDVCEASGIFEKVVQVDSYWAQSFGELAKVGLEMGWYWVTGRNRKYALKEVKKFIDISQYDLMCVSTSRGVTPGLMLLASEMECIDLLEDGLGDNTDENIKFQLSRLFESKYLIAYWFAKMGYFNVNGIFPLKSTKKCNRYSQHPELLSKNLYKTVMQLNDMSMVSESEYNELLDKTFGQNMDLKDIDAILFTTRVKDFAQEDEKYNNLVMQYLKDKGYKRVVIKKHPRDLSEYKELGMEITEINAMIPAERLLSKITTQDVYFMFASSTMQSLQKEHENVKFFVFKDLLNSQFYRNRIDRCVSEIDLKEEMKIEL